MSEFVPVDMAPVVPLSEPQGTVDIDRYFQGHDAKLDGHDYATQPPSPGEVELATKFGISPEKFSRQVPVPWTKERIKAHQERGQLVRRYAEALGYGALADDVQHLTTRHADHLAAAERLTERFEALPALDRDGDLGDVGEWEFQPYAEQLDTVIADYRRWLAEVNDAIADVDALAAWLEEAGDRAGYVRATAMFRHQPVAAARFKDMLAGKGEVKVPTVNRDQLRLPDKDELEAVKRQLLKRLNARQKARLALKQIADATTEGVPLREPFRSTFRRSGRRVRGA